MIETAAGTPVSDELVGRFFDSLINSFFKILPIRESNEPSLTVYMESLRNELMGCGNLIDGLALDSRFLKLLAILQFLIESPTATVPTVKREVFKAIRVCEQMREQYKGAG